MFIQPDKTISNFALEGVEGYLIEDEALQAKIKENYPHFNLVVEDGEVVDVEVYDPPIIPKTKEDIDMEVVGKIREAYSLNDECKMLRIGVKEPNNPEFIAYDEYAEQCRSWGRAKKAEVEGNED